MLGVENLISEMGELWYILHAWCDRLEIHYNGLHMSSKCLSRKQQGSNVGARFTQTYHTCTMGANNSPILSAATHGFNCVPVTAWECLTVAVSITSDLSGVTLCTDILPTHPATKHI